MKRLYVFVVVLLFMFSVLPVLSLADEEAKHHHEMKMDKDKKKEVCKVASEKCCPMMIEGAEVTTENISDGVVVKITSKDKEVVDKIQKSAGKMKECNKEKKSGMMDNMKKNEQVEKEEMKTNDKNEIVTCPVMGSKIKKSEAFDKTEYKGKTYYFCCGGCKPEFLSEPEKYIK